MRRYSINFLPNNRSVQVLPGTSIAEAAQSALVFITNLCGGEGLCGKCRVQVMKGQAEPEERARSLFSEDEIQKGYVLACQTQIQDDLDILIPPESRMENSQIMTAEGTEGLNESKLQPFVKKIYLELSPPTLEDNVPDIQRISRALRKNTGLNPLHFSLDCLKNLADLLRKNDWKVTVTLAWDRDRYLVLSIDPLDIADRNYGVAVDVGTTTVVAQLVNMASGALIGTEGEYNEQAKYGEDVISRMIFACGKGGLPPVQEAVVRNINQLIEKLADQYEISREEIYSIVAAGNTTMSHFLLGLSPCSIRLDPYVPTADEYPQIPARDVGIRINPNGVLETIPSVASYVGGDIVAGVMSCGIADHKEVQALIDIGTNGEIAIGNSEWLVCCSASAGPAFEGGGTRCGMRATKGAIEKVRIQNGRLKYETIGQAPPVGICGSGLIDSIYELVKNGIIGPDGKFHRSRKDVRLTFEDGIPQYTIAFPEDTETGETVLVSEADIDNLIKSKGAVFAAMKCLTDYLGLEFGNIETLYVAGGFGNFLDVPKAVAIGLLPDIPRKRIRFIGNGSLAGARICLLSEAALEKSYKISRSMTNIELSNYQPFTNEYIAALFLPHTDRKLFPSVDY